jgi:hypothetical protein
MGQHDVVQRQERRVFPEGEAEVGQRRSGVEIDGILLEAVRDRGPVQVQDDRTGGRANIALKVMFSTSTSAPRFAETSNTAPDARPSRGNAKNRYRVPSSALAGSENVNCPFSLAVFRRAWVAGLASSGSANAGAAEELPSRPS